MLAMQASLRLRSVFTASSCTQCRPRFGIALRHMARKGQAEHADSSTTRSLPRFDYDGIVEALSGSIDAYDGDGC